MRRLAFVAAFSMLALFVLAPAAFAQDQYEEQAEILEELVEEPQEPLAENVIEGQQEAAVEEQIEAQQGKELTPTQDAAVEPQVEQQSAGEQGKADEKADEKGKMEEKGKEKEKMKEVPKTGGISIDKAALVGLGAGSLLVGGGLVVGRTIR